MISRRELGAPNAPINPSMFKYYTVLIVLTFLTLGVLSILVRENARLSSREKRIFYISYALIAAAALAEWLGVFLDGRAGLPRWPLKIIKCADYIFTPGVGAAFAAQMKLSRRWNRLLLSLLSLNVIFQLVGATFGWTIVVDASNHYMHGPLYFIYILLYLSVIAIMLVGFVTYSRSFPRQNLTSLYAIMVLILAGIAMQELLEPEIRTAYITLSVAATLLFIHYSEFSQLQADEHIREQQILITTDALTGIYSRFAYNQALEEFDASRPLPQDLAAIVVDLNEVKPTNDRYGHAAGDDLIRGAAAVLEKVFSPVGRVYRTGGDEVLVFARAPRERVNQLLSDLRQQAAAWTNGPVSSISFSLGIAFAAEHPDVSAEELVKAADLAMYAAKSEYYRSSGHDRRRSRS